MFTLKNYQQETLDRLSTFLDVARVDGAKTAFEDLTKQGDKSPTYRPLTGLELVPFVCLRLPTGAGKTLLAAHTVKLAAEKYLETENPVVLWLVPTNVIRTQTLETLRKSGHPNYEVLNDAFEGRFRVFDIADFATVTPADLSNGACIFVATMATLRVDKTEGRKVYAHNENLEPHFTSVPQSTAGLEKQEDGTNTLSFRNILYMHRPLVIVDEAHRNASDLSVEVLRRINTQCIVEFTATPFKGSNILHNVSATQLKAEEMIKLPIRLTEHKSWEEAVRDSIATRKHLENVAAKDTDSYIRPIVLFQAEDRGQEVTKDVLLKYLVEQENIPREKIAVVTGEQKELDKHNLFDKRCPIDFVITVEALKEGWDCSFAYVFCSVATVKSAKDVEQMLGRVLRMPYAKRRKDDELNRAYAHVSKSSWPDAVAKLHDSLVEMGFEEHEADAFIQQAPKLDLTGGENPPASKTVETSVDVSHEEIGSFTVSEAAASFVSITKNESGYSVTLKGDVPDEVKAQITQAIKSTDARKRVEGAFKRHGAQVAIEKSPAQRGVPFKVPQLALNFGDGQTVADKDDFLDAKGWSLLDYPIELTDAEFKINEDGVTWEVDIAKDGHVVEKHVGSADQFNLNLVDTGWTQAQLSDWLTKKVRQPDVQHLTMHEVVRRAVDHLVTKRKLDLTALARWRFLLSKIITEKIGLARADASKKSYQELLFGPQASVETTFNYTYDFDPKGYAPHWVYPGHPYKFKRHYYADIGELDNSGEEFDCAKALDFNPKVKHWVRNLERRGFWLPLAQGKFYPDFVAELVDGNILVVEHKGKHLVTAQDAQEKNNVGRLWQDKSNGKARFVMTVNDPSRPSLDAQILAAI